MRHYLQRISITLEFLTIMKNETERLKLRQKYRDEVNPVLAEKHVPKDTYTFTDDYVFWLEEQLVKNIEVIPCCTELKCEGCKKPLNSGLCGSCCTDLVSGMY